MAFSDSSHVLLMREEDGNQSLVTRPCGSFTLTGLHKGKCTLVATSWPPLKWPHAKGGVEGMNTIGSLVRFQLKSLFFKVIS